jgi:hypothetical protein
MKNDNSKDNEDITGKIILEDLNLNFDFTLNPPINYTNYVSYPSLEIDHLEWLKDQKEQAEIIEIFKASKNNPALQIEIEKLKSIYYLSKEN